MMYVIVCHTIACGYYYQGFCSKPFLQIDDGGRCYYFNFQRIFAPKNEYNLDVIDDKEKEKPVIIDAKAEDLIRVEAVNSA